MNNHDIEKLEHRIKELERLVWSMFRVFETFVTWNELLETSEDEPNE